jgi:hypothetical protein
VPMETWEIMLGLSLLIGRSYIYIQTADSIACPTDNKCQ